MAKQPKDIAASVRQRLLNLVRAEGQLFDVVLVAFGLERLVYRLSVSEYRDRFVLKGGMLVTLWTADTGRFTRDIDFLAFGSDEEAELKTAFSQILAIDGDDGLVYDIESLTAVGIREDQIYGGMRLRTEARLGNTRIPITVDLGFGDALADPQYEIEYGSLLDFPASTIRADSPATVIAEKFQAVVALGLANSQMKDLYALWTLPKSVEIDILQPLAPDHRRSRVETKMHCVKLLGQRLMARDFDRQVAEFQVRVAVMNCFTALGTPITKVAG